MDERTLNRAALARQLLLERAPLPTPEAVRAAVALQAQEPASPYLALWNRVRDFDPAALDAAFADGEVVKSSLMRLTLHAVHRDDYPAFHAAMVRSLRGARLGDQRYTGTGLTVADADELTPHLLGSLDRPRTGPENRAFLAARLGSEEVAQAAWWALRTFAPMHHAPTGGPWSYGPRPAFVRAGGVWDADRDAAVRVLVERCLAGFGPATLADLARFTLLPRSVLRPVLADLPEIDRGLHDLPGLPLPDPDTPAPPRLLGMWDSVLLAHATAAGRVVPDDLRRVVTRTNGDLLPTLLVDGQVAGVWRVVDGAVEATAYRSLSAGDWAGLAAEAAALVAFLADRDPAVYRRYHHWWAKLPPGDTRPLP